MLDKEDEIKIQLDYAQLLPFQTLEEEEDDEEIDEDEVNE